MWLALRIRAQLHQIKHGVDATRDDIFGKSFSLQSKGDVVPHGQVGEQRVGLKHHVHRPVIGRNVHHIGAAQEHPTRCGSFETREHAQQGGLATPGATQQREDLTLFDGQINAVNSHHIIKAFEQVDRL